MHRGWLQLGQTEIANTARTVAYMNAGVRNLSAEVVTDDSWRDLWRWLGRDEPYRTPWDDDDCPWHDPLIPASAEFAGVWILSVDGADSTPHDVDVIDSAHVGAAFGTTRTPARHLKMEALVVGGTPAGLSYGLSWLGSVLRGDQCAPGDDARTLLWLETAPPTDDQMTTDNVIAVGNAEARMYSQVRLTSPLDVDERLGRWVPQGHGATMARVNFTLTAGVPWAWGLPTPLVSDLKPYMGEPRTVTFESIGEDGTCPSACAPASPVLVDPTAPALATLPRPINPAAAAGCSPIQSRRLTWLLEAGRTAQWMETVPTVTVRTGARDERNVRVQWVEGQPTTDSGIACATVGEAMIGYIPALSTLTLDAVTGLATVVTDDGRRLDATPMVTGRMGGPWRPAVLRCARPYTLIIDTEQSVHQDARVSVDAVMRRP